MACHIIMTPISNINDNVVVDDSKVKKLVIGFNEEVDVITKRGMKASIVMNRFSLYDDLLVYKGENYKVLHMLSK